MTCDATNKMVGLFDWKLMDKSDLMVRSGAVCSALVKWP
jgi:hypothetical protein